MMYLIFVVGILAGILAGAMACARYVRQEVAGGIAPRLKTLQLQLKHLQLQLDNLEAAVNLAIVTRYVELENRRPPDDPPRRVA